MEIKIPASGKQRILITGAAGFLGSHLCDRFIKEGMDVVGMDNLITGDLKNIQHLFRLENFEFYHCDVSKFIHISGRLDYILHFASPARPILNPLANRHRKAEAGSKRLGAVDDESGEGA